MKKLVLMMALMLATMTVKANNILYFTYNQAARTVACLNGQDELMIYCGYEDELPTYVLINEVWAEQISSSFYEIWLYGYDAYTGEEIYMPIDLECIYLMQHGKIYSAAQYLRFRTTHARPTFAWAMPPYNPFVRAPRPTVYYYTYHYDIHRPGWHWRHYPHIHYHPYYMRRPNVPAPMPPKPYTPGHEYPGYHTTDNGYQYDNLPLVGRVTAPRSATNVQNNPTGRSGSRITSDRKSNTITTTDRVTGIRTTSNAPSRTESLSGRGTRDNDISTRGNNSASRSEGTSTRSGSTTTRESGTSTSRSGNDSGKSTSRTGSASSRSGNDSGNSSSRTGSSTSRSGNATGNNSSRGNSNVGTSSSRSGDAIETPTTRSSSKTSSRSNATTTPQEDKKVSTPATRSSSTTQRGTTTATRSGSTTATPATRGGSSTPASSRAGSSTTTRGSQSASRGTTTGGRN